jgi:predicted nucleic acid-binding protein
MSFRLYLDVCCFNRPFDDWSQSRIRLEAEAILAILERCETASWTLVSSTAIESEIDRTPDPTRKQRLVDSLAIASERVIVTESIMVRANDFKKNDFKAFDALHIACAEFASVDALLTTDDRLLRKAVSQRADLSVRVANPVTWFMEVSNR